ncbi:MAG: DUF4231 domain-containing protein [Anaerolineae bacterium]|nr:DUF4231 domain-containing protein [Anaerolineae bacterium]
MSEKSTNHKGTDRTTPAADSPTPPPPPPPTTTWNRLPKWLQEMITFFWELVRRIFTMIRSLFFLVVDTVTMVLPSSALTSRRDDETYIRELREELTGVIENLPLEPEQKNVIFKNWLPQLIWTNGRANRERNANELIRWWQIILGVLIPVFTTPVAFGIAQTTGTAEAAGNPSSLGVTGVQIGAVMGVFVAVLTALAQFRRPEDRWRHYRILAENYLMELWDFITLSNEAYKETKTHSESFPIFNQRMTRLRRDDVNAFFSEVTSRTMDMDEMKKQITDLKGFLITLKEDGKPGADKDTAG